MKGAVLLIACVTGAFLVTNVAADGHDKKLLVLLIDGFRWDYFNRFSDGELPGFDKLMKRGVKAQYLQSVFPSYSFVNFYSLMTGKEPQLASNLYNNTLFNYVSMILIYISALTPLLICQGICQDCNGR